MRCERCGAALVHNVITGGSGGRYDYFTCARRLEDRSCDLPYLRVEDVEAKIETLWQREQLAPTQIEQLRADLLHQIDTRNKATSAR